MAPIVIGRRVQRPHGPEVGEGGSTAEAVVAATTATTKAPMVKVDPLHEVGPGQASGGNAQPRPKVEGAQRHQEM